ncbi:hypothetical protein BDV06DRAFT_196859 [Aspergillus oleicola]
MLLIDEPQTWVQKRPASYMALAYFCVHAIRLAKRQFRDQNSISKYCIKGMTKLSHD